MKNSADFELYDKIKKYRRSILKTSVLVLFVACLLVYACACYYSGVNAFQKEAQLCSAINAEADQNVAAFMKKMEDTAKLIMGNEDYAKYDPADTSKSEFAVLNEENALTERLIELSTLGNYTDFGIVSSNEHNVGKITDGTKDIFDDEIYKRISALMGDSKIKWFTGQDNNYRRVYFAGRINDDLIFISSVFSTEFDLVFLPSDNYSEINTMLCDDDGRIIYANDGKRVVGEKLDEKLSKFLEGGTGVTVSDMTTICTIDDCSDDWVVITTVDMSDTLRHYVRTGLKCFGIFICCAVIFIMISAAAAADNDPQNGPKFGKYPKVDENTGLFTAEYTENSIMDKMETCISGSTIAFIIVKITNLELIRLNYGEEIVAEAERKVAEILVGNRKEGDICGIFREGEFVLFADHTNFDLVRAYGNVRAYVKELNDKLKECCLDDDRGYIKCAVGASVYPETSDDYDELYEMAEKACEKAEHSEDARAVIYDKKEEEVSRS